MEVEPTVAVAVPFFIFHNNTLDFGTGTNVSGFFNGRTFFLFLYYYVRREFVLFPGFTTKFNITSVGSLFCCNCWKGCVEILVQVH